MRLMWLFVLPVVTGYYNMKVCSDFGYNWAGEIRCLRNLLTQCQDGTLSREPRTIDSRLAPHRYAQQFRNHHHSHHNANHNAQTSTDNSSEVLMKNVTDLVEQRVKQMSDKWEREMNRRINDLRNWFDSEIKRLENSAGSNQVPSDYSRQMEIDLKKLTKRLDLLSARVHRHGQHEYIFLTDRESWYRAEEICLQWGGHLASIDSHEENKFLAGLLEGETAWIGLNDVQLENVYVNTDRTQTKFRYWAKGQPDNQNHNENCIEMGRNGQWSDLLCLLRRPFFCKR